MHQLSLWGVKVYGIFFWPLWSMVWLLVVWCAGALWYQRWLPNPAGKILLLALFLCAAGALQFFCLKFRWLLPGSILLPCLYIIGWLAFQRPTGEHDWDPPFARMPVAHFSPDEKSVTIENIRDFHYRAEFDYDIRYRTETYHFDDLQTMDYSITHWNDQEYFGHIMLSFGFKDGRKLVFSPEARQERGKKYEIMPGIYRNYELIFILATEEDAYMLRTHHRRYEHEEVLLYPTNTQPEIAVFLLKDLLKRANKLRTEPEFYNGVTYNCLSTMAPTAEKLGFRFCTGWRGTFNGISDRLGYRTGWLRRSRADESFADYRKRHSVNQYVEHLVDPPDYSQLIRPDRFPEK